MNEFVTKVYGKRSYWWLLHVGLICPHRSYPWPHRGCRQISQCSPTRRSRRLSLTNAFHWVSHVRQEGGVSPWRTGLCFCLRAPTGWSSTLQVRGRLDGPGMLAGDIPDMPPISSHWFYIVSPTGWLANVGTRKLRLRRLMYRVINMLSPLAIREKSLQFHLTK